MTNKNSGREVLSGRDLWRRLQLAFGVGLIIFGATLSGTDYPLAVGIAWLYPALFYAAGVLSIAYTVVNPESPWDNAYIVIITTLFAVRGVSLTMIPGAGLGGFAIYCLLIIPSVVSCWYVLTKYDLIKKESK